MVGVFLKNHVLELKKRHFRKAKGVCAQKSDREVLDYPFCCLCSQMCIHKSALISHFEAKQADIKSRAPSSRRFRKSASQERPLCFVGSHQTLASHVAFFAVDVVEAIPPLGRSQHPSVEVVVA